MRACICVSAIIMLMLIMMLMLLMVLVLYTSYNAHANAHYGDYASAIYAIDNYAFYVLDKTYRAIP